jgi:hypothetical protein
MMLMAIITHTAMQTNFDKIIGWGRMGLLIAYNSNIETIRLRDDVVTNH